MESRASRRIMKELQSFQADTSLESLKLEVLSADVWQVTFSGATGTIFEGERFTLNIKFGKEYPMEAPEVVFLSPSPMHPHIYSNGHICLNILGDDWSPALTVKSICISIISMLSSASVKARPPDDERYSMFHKGGPKNSRFVYHDDTV